MPGGVLIDAIVRLVYAHRRHVIQLHLALVVSTPLHIVDEHYGGSGPHCHHHNAKQYERNEVEDGDAHKRLLTQRSLLGRLLKHENCAMYHVHQGALVQRVHEIKADVCVDLEALHEDEEQLLQILLILRAVGELHYETVTLRSPVHAVASFAAFRGLHQAVRAGVDRAFRERLLDVHPRLRQSNGQLCKLLLPSHDEVLPLVYRVRTLSLGARPKGLASEHGQRNVPKVTKSYRLVGPIVDGSFCLRLFHLEHHRLPGRPLNYAGLPRWQQIDVHVERVVLHDWLFEGVVRHPRKLLEQVAVHVLQIFEVRPDGGSFCLIAAFHYHDLATHGDVVGQPVGAVLVTLVAVHPSRHAEQRSVVRGDSGAELGKCDVVVQQPLLVTTKLCFGHHVVATVQCVKHAFVGHSSQRHRRSIWMIAVLYAVVRLEPQVSERVGNDADDHHDPHTDPPKGLLPCRARDL
mmetsp:Transcript_1420/g.4233  ORF Transcript_1420/g.4233 Transcript_1420/m.4233 type:complete len:462 (+) Transcript_1420:372-1757(+)